MASQLGQGGCPVLSGNAGRRAVANVLRRVTGRSTLRFHYCSMATIGRTAAVPVLSRAKLSGRPAWLAWLATASSSPSTWARAYITWSRGARLITHGRR